MRIALYTDNTLPIALRPLSELLNSVCNNIDFVVGAQQFRIDAPEISRPATYESLPQALLEEAAQCDAAFLCSNVRRHNNYLRNDFDRNIHRLIGAIHRQ